MKKSVGLFVGTLLTLTFGGMLPLLAMDIDTSENVRHHSAMLGDTKIVILGAIEPKDLVHTAQTSKGFRKASVAVMVERLKNKGVVLHQDDGEDLIVNVFQGTFIVAPIITLNHPFLLGTVIHTPDSAGKSLADMAQEIKTTTKNWGSETFKPIKVNPNTSLVRQHSSVLGGSFKAEDNRKSADDFMKILGITSLEGVYTPPSPRQNINNNLPKDNPVNLRSAYFTYSYYDPILGGLHFCVTVYQNKEKK